MGTGNRVAHFNGEADPSCTFCIKEKTFPAPIESFSHIFYDCQHVNLIIQKFVEKYFNLEVTRNLFFEGSIELNGRDAMAVHLVLDALRYSIWEFKLLKKKLSYYSVESETIRTLECICLTSNKIKQSINQCTFINVDGVRRPQFDGRP